MVRLCVRQRGEGRKHLFEELEHEIAADREINLVITALHVLDCHLFELNHRVVATHPMICDLIPIVRLALLEPQRRFQRENHVHRLQREEPNEKRRLRKRVEQRLNHFNIVNVPILQLHQLRIPRFSTHRRFLHGAHFLSLTIRFDSHEKPPELRVESPHELLVHLQNDLLEGHEAAIHVKTVLLVRVPLAAEV